MPPIDALPISPEQAAQVAPLSWLAVPTFAYDADDGLGGGARVELVRPDATLEPYRAKWIAHAYATLRGFHHHRVRFDVLGLGERADTRLTGHFAYRAWLNDGYWGVGNGTAREVAWDGPWDADAPERKRYRYRLVQPFAQVGARRDLGGPVTVYATANVRHSTVEPYAGSLLEEAPPEAMGGGFAGQLGAGVLWDTRDEEVTPNRGWFLEAGGRAVGGAGSFGGPIGVVRAWVPLTPWAVLGERVMAEWLFGDVPFYEMVHWGGATPIAGVGGAETARGIPFGRWRAPGKALSNTELRLDVARVPIRGQVLRLQAVPFVDAVSVWGAGDDADAPAPEVPLHPSAGGGIRAIWAETMVGRVDVGVGQDLTDAGPATTWGTYLVFDHMF